MGNTTALGSSRGKRRLGALTSFGVAGALVVTGTLGTASAGVRGADEPVGAGAGSIAGLAASLSAPDAGPADGEPAAEPPADYTFVSMPDFLNQDVGDVSGLPGYRPALGNSISESYREGLDIVLDDVASHAPADVLVAGDLVQGHWGRDPTGSGVFGPTRTPAQRLRALRTAGNLYYRQWTQRFASHGLRVHAALGDHDVGDNPWSGNSARIRSKRALVPAHKAVWARHFTRGATGGHRYRMRPPGPARDTAYAQRLAPEVLLVTVDNFQQTRRGMRMGLDRQQLTWLDRVLARGRRAGIDWIIVQGHVPVLTPVRIQSSSGLTMAQGARSPFWRTLRRHRVDLYLNGEVHATTARTRDRVTQIAHGGLFYAGDASYLVGQVRGDQLELEIREFDATKSRANGELWSISKVRKAADVDYTPGSFVVGTMTLRKDNTILERSGLLAPYLP
ncbi:metallophosphoesterase family protein [Nocardioides pacificus]